MVDSCMVTIKIDKAGNRTYSGSMDDYGNFWGSVYLDYEGIAHAVAWSNPDSLRSYFNITINYETQLRSRHTVFVCYQREDGNYGGYDAVINQDYVYGETVSWFRNEDDCYNGTGISYTATRDNTSYLSRKQYTQNVYIKYQDANGNYSRDWICAESRNVFYGAGYAWAYGGDACYNAAFVNPYTVTGGLNHFIQT